MMKGSVRSTAWSALSLLALAVFAASASVTTHLDTEIAPSNLAGPDSAVQQGSSSLYELPAPAVPMPWMPWEHWQRRRGAVLDDSNTTTTTNLQGSNHKPKKGDKDGALNIENKSWFWVILIVCLSFFGMLLLTKKLEMLGGLSLRIYMMRYISVETIYTTMEGMDAADFQEQRDAEWGQQSFTFIGIVFMIAHKLWNPNSDERTAFVVLTLLQIVLMFVGMVFDCWMIRAGYLRSVRSLNTKLRWSHCVYQMVLFVSDLAGNDLELPVDCFIWATMHYSYEAIGLALWALNVDGFSEMAIIALLNAKILETTVASTGWTCAFGLCTLTLSCVSIVIGIAWKFVFRIPDTDADKEELEAALAVDRPPATVDAVHSQNTFRTEGSKPRGLSVISSSVRPPLLSSEGHPPRRTTFFLARQKSRVSLTDMAAPSSIH